MIFFINPQNSPIEYEAMQNHTHPSEQFAPAADTRIQQYPETCNWGQHNPQGAGHTDVQEVPVRVVPLHEPAAAHRPWRAISQNQKKTVKNGIFVAVEENEDGVRNF